MMTYTISQKCVQMKGKRKLKIPLKACNFPQFHGQHTTSSKIDGCMHCVTKWMNMMMVKRN